MRSTCVNDEETKNEIDNMCDGAHHTRWLARFHTLSTGSTYMMMVLIWWLGGCLVVCDTQNGDIDSSVVFCDLMPLI